jgi:hypothetical protein
MSAPAAAAVAVAAAAVKERPLDEKYAGES